MFCLKSYSSKCHSLLNTPSDSIFSEWSYLPWMVASLAATFRGSFSSL